LGAFDLNKPMTIYHLAEQCNVSVSTVSRVLNNSPYVSEKTRKNIMCMIEKYNYTPNSLAQAMIRNRTATIGVIIPDITYPFFSILFSEIERYAATYNYSVMLANTFHGGSSRGISGCFDTGNYFKMMRSRKIDGIIIVGGEIDMLPIAPDYIKALNQLNEFQPVVIIGEAINEIKCCFVNRNLGGGIASAVQHLAALGHRRIGYIGGKATIRLTDAQVKMFIKTLESMQLPYDSDNVVLSGYYAKDGFETVNRLLNSNTPRPTALLAANDQVAIGAIRALSDAGLSVPEDCAIVSCDMFFDSEYCTPRLTTLDQQHDYLGRLSVMTLLSAMNGIKDPIQIDHNPRLIIRESCGSQLGKRTI
jgi:LacI family transcriptional regulator